jgi:hypothetical protein
MRFEAAEREGDQNDAKSVNFADSSQKAMLPEPSNANTAKVD